MTAPTSPPELLSAVEVTSNSVKLFWDPPSVSDHNGLIRNYIIKQTEISTGAVKYYYATDASFVATALHPYYNYSYSVAAVTVAPGPYSDSIAVLTEQDGSL